MIPIIQITLNAKSVNLHVRNYLRSVDHVQGQGITRIENGAYTLVREHFNSRDNAAIGREMHLCDSFEGDNRERPPHCPTICATGND